MQKYFDFYYDGPGLQLFGTGHLITLSIIAAAVAFLIWGWNDPSAAARRNARFAMVALFLITKGSWHAWNVYYDNWSIQAHLPLHLCSISAWCAIYVLITRSHRVYEIVYFVGIAGATQALLTPEANMYALPHFRAVQTFTGHGMIVIALVYMTTIEGFRPTWSSIWKTMLVANVYMLFVTIVNLLIDSNYMYTMRKPSAASLLDLMGPWPWYLFAAELLALFLFILLYLPFAIRDRQARLAASVADA